ncbi:MAG: HAD-IIIA family hydrolase [Eubacteriales bacterium]
MIMAGGKGTRMTSVSGEIPKAMLTVAGKPILEHQIKCLESQGYCDIIIVTGHLGDAIHSYFGDGKNFGVCIEYYDESKPLGTAGALIALKNKLAEDFLLINGDLIFDIDFKRFEAFHNSKNALATLFTHPNNHPFDSEIIVADSDSRIIGWLGRREKRVAFKNCVNAGIHILAPEVLSVYSQLGKLDLDKDILMPMLETGRLYAYNSPEYVKDMGTPKRYKEVCDDFISGKVSARNIRNKQKAVFMDRDGTINEYLGFVTKAEQITLIESAAKGISKVNNSEYLAIVITNQPIIARGECTVEELERIHNRLEDLLGEHGAYLDAIYYCPHHPDKGFEGEMSEYKVECDCRKPKPGLIFQAANDYNIDLQQSYMVGDDVKDLLAGHAAGCKTAYLLSGKTTNEPIEGTIFNNLLEFVDKNIRESGKI